MYPKKKIEVIIEQPASRIISDLLDRHGAHGYTVLPCLTGRGTSGRWELSHVTDARQQVMFVAVLAADRSDAIIAELTAVLSDFHGVVFVSDVEVVRSERF
jgi:nitrogen regulatory protein PII